MIIIFIDFDKFGKIIESLILTLFAVDFWVLLHMFDNSFD